MGDAEDQFEDVAGGAAEFDDYNYNFYGSGSDKPFKLTKGITTDTTSVISSINTNWTASGGADGPESSMEALYQAASGMGYDQNCNGTYDSTSDVLPFIDSAGDAFGGGEGQSYDSSLAGSGTRGGFGFRDYSLPIIIYATDNYMRDRTQATRHTTGPRWMPIDAGVRRRDRLGMI